MAEDILGNEVTGANGETLKGINDFITGFLGYKNCATNVLKCADDDGECVVANTYAGMIWMFLEANEAPQKADKYLRAAQKNAHLVSLREQMMVQVLAHWVANDMEHALAVGEEIARKFPRDLTSVKLNNYFSFNRGDSPSMLRVGKLVAAENQHNAHYHGMMAFAYEQCHLLDKAEKSARRSLELNNDEPWAQHAIAHVMLTQGRIPEGAKFMKQSSRSWVDLNSFMFTHNWWHTALFDLSLGDYQAVFDAYDGKIWGIEKDYSQDQIGAVAMLARMEIAGLDVGNRWEDVAKHLRARAQDVVQPFLTIQYLYGLARAELSEADQLMAAVEDKAAHAEAFERHAWQNVALPACKGVLALARGDAKGAISNLEMALPRMAAIGGSHAQRDLFEQLLLDAHMKSGNWGIAQQMMEMRRTFDPDGVPLNNMLAGVYDKLELPEEAKEARARQYA